MTTTFLQNSSAAWWPSKLSYVATPAKSTRVRTALATRVPNNLCVSVEFDLWRLELWTILLSYLCLHPYHFWAPWVWLDGPYMSTVPFSKARVGVSVIFIGNPVWLKRHPRDQVLYCFPATCPNLRQEIKGDNLSFCCCCHNNNNSAKFICTLH